MTLKVIGAGLARTGTLSLKTALEQLGFGPCHHMTELARHPERWPLWSRAFDGESVDWEAIFEGFNSAVDMPACLFYRELAERYPEAKLILTIRDPENWFDSMLGTLLLKSHQEKVAKTPIASLMPKMFAYAAKKRGVGLSGTASPTEPPNRAAAIAVFEAHNAEVRRTIPAARLLVFQASQGWAPLCRFLGVPVPETPYPHVNEQGKWQNILPIVSKM